MHAAVAPVVRAMGATDALRQCQPGSAFCPRIVTPPGAASPARRVGHQTSAPSPPRASAGPVPAPCLGWVRSGPGVGRRKSPLRQGRSASGSAGTASLRSPPHHCRPLACAAPALPGPGRPHPRQGAGARPANTSGSRSPGDGPHADRDPPPQAAPDERGTTRMLSVAQRAYVAHDPRWPEHRRKLAAAQEARRMTLFDNEVAAIVGAAPQGPDVLLHRRGDRRLPRRDRARAQGAGDRYHSHQGRPPAPPGAGSLGGASTTDHPPDLPAW